MRIRRSIPLYTRSGERGAAAPLTREQFSRRWIPEPNTGCWLWTGATSGPWPFEYGRLIRRGGRLIKAHRESYEIHRGEVPDTLKVCHHCDTPLCVNPDHLFLGTQRQNLADMREKSRHPGPTPLRGEAGNSAKLTEAAVREVRALKGVEPQRVTATRLGVSQSAIMRIVTRRNWKHVP